MAQQIINIGTVADDGTGDDVRLAFNKSNENFTELYSAALNPSSSVVSIYTMDDFPDAVSGVRTLAADTVYVVNASISTSDRLVFSQNTSLVSVSQTAIVFTYTGSSTFITVGDHDAYVANIALTALTSGATIFSFSTTTTRVLYLNGIILRGYNLGSFSGVGYVVGALECVFSEQINAGFSFAGSCRNFSFTNSGLRATAGIYFDLGVCVFDAFSVESVSYAVPSGVTFISGLAGSANISAGGRGYVAGCQGSGAGTNLSGVSSGDARWRFIGNTPIADTIRDFLIYFEGNATATTINTAGVYERVNLGGSYTTDHANGFTVDTATGRVTSNVVSDIKIPVDMCLSLEPVSGSNQDLSIKLAVNGTVEGPEHLIRASNGTPTVATIPWQPDLSENDYVEVFVTNTSGTIDVLVSSCTIRGN